MAAKWLLGGAMALAGCQDVPRASGGGGPGPAGAPTLETVLGWLPTDTESIIVAAPFELLQSRPEDPLAHQRAALARVTIGAFSLPGHDGPARSGPVLEAMMGSRLRLGVKAARRFTSPDTLGPARYEGCDIAVFEDPADAARALAAAKALASTRSGGARGGRLAFDEEIEGKPWTFHLAPAGDRVLLCATHAGYLDELLDRFAGRARGSFREEIEQRDEWNAIDRQGSPVWSIRLFRPENAATDPGSALNEGNVLGKGSDPRATAAGFSLAPNGATLHGWYFTGARDALEAARRFWVPRQVRETAKATRVTPGVVRIDFDLADPRGGGFPILVAVCLSGHAIYF